MHIYKKKKRTNRGSKSTMGFINICRSGHIGINVFLKQKLQLAPGRTLLIAKDGESRNDWYMSFGTNEQEGYSLRSVYVNNREYGMSADLHPSITGEILASVKAETSASFCVALGNPKIENGRTWYRILTATPKFTR